MKKSANYQKFKSWLIILFYLYLPIFVFILLTKFIIFDPSIEFIDDFLDPRGKGLEEYFVVVFVLCLIWNIVVIITNKKYFLSVAIPVLFWILVFLIFFSMWSHPPIASAKYKATKAIHMSVVLEVQEESIYLFDAESIISKVVKNRDDKNPYSTKNNAVRISTSNTLKRDVGYINLSTSGTNVVVKSCHVTPCDIERNRRSDTIEIK